MTLSSMRFDRRKGQPFRDDCGIVHYATRLTKKEADYLFRLADTTRAVVGCLRCLAVKGEACRRKDGKPMANHTEAFVPCWMRASMSETKRSFYLRVSTIVTVLVGLGIGAAMWRIFTAPQEALPMKGDCTDVPMRKYVGGGDRDGKSCLWKGQKYWCMYDPNKNLWGCDLVEPVSAEKK